ncbi:MAG: hypothetical protein RB292_01010 [Patescibacteria group bacterium]|nr:hypothetical protein [Patescibacteria group bacterium]
MYHAIKTGVTLAVGLAVLQMFLPDVGSKLVELITTVIDIMLVTINQASTNLPS